MVNYKKKYLKYKVKYLNEKKNQNNSQEGGSNPLEWIYYKGREMLGVASNVEGMRTEALTFYEEQLKITNEKIIETENKLKDLNELLLYNINVREELLNDSPELYKIRYDELELLEEQYNKDLDNTLNETNIANIKKTYNDKKKELTEKLEYELFIRKKTHESSLQLSENTIEHLKEEIELKEKQLNDFRENIVRFENTIKEITFYLEGPEDDTSLVDELERKAAILRGEVVEVDLNEDKNEDKNKKNEMDDEEPRQLLN